MPKQILQELRFLKKSYHIENFPTNVISYAYRSDLFFVQTNRTNKKTLINSDLNSYILSAKFVNTTSKDLKSPIEIIFQLYDAFAMMFAFLLERRQESCTLSLYTLSCPSIKEEDPFRLQKFSHLYFLGLQNIFSWLEFSQRGKSFRNVVKLHFQ